MTRWGPLQCDGCDRPVRILFRPDDGEPVYYCKCREYHGPLNLDLVDGGPDSIIDDWNAYP